MAPISGLFGRALLAFLVLPGTVALLIPWFGFRPGASGQFHMIGLVPFTIGAILLLWCARDFYVAGHGTLAPWAPPERLVIVGLYRVSRNPMYIAVMLMLCGWALAYRSRPLWIYALAVMVLFHLRVVFGEEPWLARTHREQWAWYKATVPRWLGVPR
jgi:protein-S-isoprenylcysteine O-methyltransferase Ste14